MGWRDLLSVAKEVTLPWLGGREVYDRSRLWTIKGKLPPEYGWYKFRVSGGRHAELIGGGDPDYSYEEKRKTQKGYLIGDRFVPDDARVDPDPSKLILQTEPVYLVEFGLERFSRALVALSEDKKLVFIRQEFPEGPEMEVTTAYQDRKDSVGNISGVTPALDLAFRFLSRERVQAEIREVERLKRLEEEARQREKEEKLAEARKSMGSAIGRRELAKLDFNAAAKAALAVSNAVFLDAVPSRRRNEMVVTYRYRNRRLECVVDKATLQIVDAGICLSDHNGVTGDTWLSLEALPGVLQEALDTNQLVVLRHNEYTEDYDD